MTIDELQAALKLFLEQYQAAPLFGGYSKTFKQRLDSKRDILSSFTENLKMMKCLSDTEVQEKIQSVIDSMMKELS